MARRSQQQRHPSERNLAIVSAMKAGTSNTVIADQFGLSRERVGQIGERNGIKRGPKHGHDPKFIAKCRKLWDTDISAAEVGRRVGTTKNAIIGIAHRYEFAPRLSPIIEVSDIKARRAIVKRWNVGVYSTADLAEYFHTEVQAIRNAIEYARRHGWTVAKQTPATRARLMKSYNEKFRAEVGDTRFRAILSARLIKARSSINHAK